jgi:hypothetical protein
MRQEGAQAPLTVDELATAEAVGQRRWRARTASIGFGHGRRRSQDERARGVVTARRGSDSGRRGRDGCRDTGAWSRQRP